MKTKEIIHHTLYLPKYLVDGSLLPRLTNAWRKQKQVTRSLDWEKAKIQNSLLEMKISRSLKIQLYPDSELSRVIYCHDFELNERKFVQRFLRKGDVFVDVGANIGLFTIIAGHTVGSQGIVYSFEPISKTFGRLKENVTLNHLSNVNCVNIALSSENRFAEMTISLDGFDAWNSLAKPSAGSKFDIEKVKCITFDDFVLQNNVTKVHLMKIDVEGWEKYVLDGAEQTLSSPDAPVLLIEFTDKNALGAGSSCQELYKKLQVLGYKMYTYDARKNHLTPDPIRSDYPYLNLIATKEVQLVQNRLIHKRFL